MPHEILVKGPKIIRALSLNQQALFRHTIRVKRLSRLLAGEMKMASHEVSLVRIAAILHDLGKLNPEMWELFFETPGKFTSEQARRASAHAYLSGVLIRQHWKESGLFPEEWMVSPVVFMVTGHHWWYRESSQRLFKLLRDPEFRHFLQEFPLENREIVLSGMRVLKVADYYTARTERRHYVERALTPKETLEEIESGSGSQFDPRVVRALRCLMVRSKIKHLQI